MMNHLVKRSELALARSKVYELLAALYTGPPDLELLRILRRWAASLQDSGSSSHLLSVQMKQGLTTIDSFLQKEEKTDEKKLQESISVEFTRLFRGIKPDYSPLPPYESVYRQEFGHVFGESTFEVYRKYRHFGFDLTSEFRGEPPDHISFELEFMHLMCSGEAKAWESDDEDEALRYLKEEKEFLEKHLLSWLPEFCDKIRMFDRISLFCGIADFTEGWVVFDYQEHIMEYAFSLKQ